jgi:hypothetical protein
MNISKEFNTPILFLVFNRPDTTQLVFDEIRKVKPKQLFIASDGPRQGNKQDKINCNKVKEIISNIDWSCEVKTLFREENLGCKKAVSSAITWFFQNVEEGIILEDDCLPSQSFFYFCQELLEKYRYDTRIMVISGFNKKNIWNPTKYDYFFSNLGGIWGWASWKRAWVHYDPEMKLLDKCIKDRYLNYLFGNRSGIIRANNFINAPTSSWAFPWGFARNINNGLACVPAKSLIKNIGFSQSATHTKKNNFNMASIERYNIDFPIKNNPIVIADKKYDDMFLKDNINIIEKLINLIR